MDWLTSSEHQEFEHIVGLLQHLRLNWLLHHFPPRIVHAIYMLLAGFITVAILSLLAFASKNPFIFPSVGPTAYLFFFTPMAKTASPRNAILGHGIGLLCGYGALRITGAIPVLSSMHPGLSAGIYWPMVFSAAISLATTGAFMILLRVSHPPAGATTLIVSLGLISQPRDLLVLEVAVIVLTVLAFGINRLAGLPYPVWYPRKDARTAAM